MFKKLLLIFLFISTSHFLFSQITVSSPVLRQVFQRDLTNQAVVTITGSYSQPIDTIQVRLTPVKSGQGVAVDWSVIKSSPLGGLFKGSIVVKGGWYIMEVRGLLGGQVVGNISKIDRVGVGEVFVIAGQSNAGGSSLFETNETASGDDRVNCANFISPRFYDPRGNASAFFRADLSQFSIVEFSQLKKTSAIGPTGLGPYYWGKVGDALSAKLNVPILFFNAGWAGASVRVWRESAENPTLGVPSDFQFDNTNSNKYPVGYPYANLNAVLRFYGINLGVRAVLWMEGETQNLLNLNALATGQTPPVTTESYLDNLRRLVKRTRQDLGTNKLAWVVAQTSYSGQLNCGTNNDASPPKPSPIIVKAQIDAISDPTLAPIYPGPFTDNIQTAKSNEREQCVHFTGKGLDDAAAVWVKALTVDNKNFFETVEPILADTIPSVSLDCISSSKLRLTLPEGYKSYEWSNTTTSESSSLRTITAGAGTYVARVTRANGNIIQVPAFTVRANTPAQAPTVTAQSDVNFCLGTSVLLKSSTEADNPIYEWVSVPAIGNLPRTKDISASREATYKLRVIDKNACASPYSTDIKLTAKPRPETPSIGSSGSTEFCDGQSLVLTSTNVGASSYLWSNGENTQVITVKKSGAFSVQTRGSNGCLSPSSKDNIFTIVNPLPPTPQIRALSDTVFCDGGGVSLVLTPSDNSTKFGWDRSGRVNGSDNTTTIKSLDTELIRGFVTDNKNCNSKLSNAIQVVKKDNPKAVTVFQKGTYTLAARSDRPADEYTWKFNGKTLQVSVKDTVIRAIDAGKYSVIGKNIYKVRSSAGTLTCLSAEDSYDLVAYDDKGVSIYPNPSTGQIFLESRNDLENVTITIYTVDGRLIYETKVNVLNTQKMIDLSNFTQGKYVLRVDANNFKIAKIINILDK